LGVLAVGPVFSPLAEGAAERVTEGGVPGGFVSVVRLPMPEVVLAPPTPAAGALPEFRPGLADCARAPMPLAVKTEAARTRRRAVIIDMSVLRSLNSHFQLMFQLNRG